MFLGVTCGGMTIVHGIVASGTPAFFGGVLRLKRNNWYLIVDVQHAMVIIVKKFYRGFR